jgi:hypothetical protein
MKFKVIHDSVVVIPNFKFCSGWSGSKVLYCNSVICRSEVVGLSSNSHSDLISQGCVDPTSAPTPHPTPAPTPYRRRRRTFYDRRRRTFYDDRRRRRTFYDRRRRTFYDDRRRSAFFARRAFIKDIKFFREIKEIQ